MRPAPPIVWACTGSKVWRAARAALAGAAAATLVAWIAGHLAWQQPGLVLAPWGAAVMATLCTWRWAEDANGTLSWSGRAWAWQGTHAPAAVDVVTSIALDLQWAMLLRLKPTASAGAPAASIWLVVTRVQDPQRWPHLCATLLLATRAPDEP